MSLNLSRNAVVRAIYMLRDERHIDECTSYLVSFVMLLSEAQSKYYEDKGGDRVVKTSFVVLAQEEVSNSL